MANTLNTLGSGVQPASTSNPVAASAAVGGSTPVSKTMFLQLLVAQIKNQDPMNPSDGVQFLSQLAQFQQLEQGLNMGQDIAAIRSDLDKVSSTTPTN